MKTEVEAKFLVKDKLLHEDLYRLRSLEGFRVVSKRRERQANAYFDTRGLDLCQAGAVLKLRRVGRRRELTFKSRISTREGISRRMEVTVPLTESGLRRFTLGKLEAEPVRWARAIVGRSPLKKVFTLLTDRRKMILASGRHRVELDLDRVTVGKGGELEEVELENLTASPEVYRRALRGLRRRFGRRMRPTDLPKAEWGFRLLRRGGKPGRRPPS